MRWFLEGNNKDKKLSQDYKIKVNFKIIREIQFFENGGDFNLVYFL